MRLIAVLEAGRRDFREALRGISPDQASARPTPDSWTILECIEHVTVAENRSLDRISRGKPTDAQRDPDKEMRLFAAIRNRSTKVPAPDALRPTGRHHTLADALAEFEAVRDRTIAIVQERGDGVYALSARHPYFGQLNGGELIELIDGHARRHADQIREIHEALLSTGNRRRKASPSGKPLASQRDTPDLPQQLDPLPDALRRFVDGDSIRIHETLLLDLERPNLTVDTFSLEGCVLERVQLAGGRFGSITWKDVRLVGCDLANIRTHRLTLVRVELIDCRLTGFCATASDWKDVLIRDGDMRYAQLAGGIFRSSEFSGCNWQEADLQNADLTASTFRSCNLALADLRGAKLHAADLRTSQLEGMVAGVNDLRGAIVEPAQAMILARLLGLEIR